MTTKEELAKRWPEKEREAHDRVNRVKATVYEGFRSAGNPEGGAMFLFDLGLRFALKHPARAKSFITQEEALVFSHLEDVGAHFTQIDMQTLVDAYVESMIDDDSPVLEATRRVSRERKTQKAREKEPIN